MCYPISVRRNVQSSSAKSCAAKRLDTNQRMTLGVQAVAGQRAVTELAKEHQVSRKFVGQQTDIARTALVDAFEGSDAAMTESCLSCP